MEQDRRKVQQDIGMVVEKAKAITQGKKKRGAVKKQVEMKDLAKLIRISSPLH